MGIMIAAAVVVLLVLWAVSCQRRLAVMDENINNAMAQIGVQLSSRFDALTALLDLTKGYAAHESQTLIETISQERDHGYFHAGRGAEAGRDYFRGAGPYCHGLRAIPGIESQ